MVLSLFVGGATLALATGCATGAGGAGGSPVHASISPDDARVDVARPGMLTFPNATVDDLWRVIPAAFQALGIPAGILDPANRVYGNDRVTEQRVADRPLRELFRCGSGGGLTRTTYRIQFGITAQPFPRRDGGAEVILETRATGRAMSANASGTTQCTSNGRLEMAFQETLESLLRGGQ
jgi:hypothetical protein